MNKTFFSVLFFTLAVILLSSVPVSSLADDECFCAGWWGNSMTRESWIAIPPIECEHTCCNQDSASVCGPDGHQECCSTDNTDCYLHIGPEAVPKGDCCLKDTQHICSSSIGLYPSCCSNSQDCVDSSTGVFCCDKVEGQSNVLGAPGSQTCGCTIDRDCVPAGELADYICGAEGCVKGPFWTEDGMETDTLVCNAVNGCEFSIDVQPHVGEPCIFGGGLKEGDSCGEKIAVEPAEYGCRANEVMQRFNEPKCINEVCTPTSTFQSKEEPHICTGLDKKLDGEGNLVPVIHDSRCVFTGGENRYAYSICSPAEVNDGCLDEPIGAKCGKCFTTYKWVDNGCKNGCVFATDAPNNLRCGVNPATGNSCIDRKFICSQCKENPKIPCPKTDVWKTAIDCGVPQNVNVTYCVGNDKYVMTATYPGQCFYSFFNPNIVGGCLAPQVVIAYSGPCDDGDGDGDGDGANLTHNECDNQRQCVVINGPGNSACQNAIDCAGGDSHLECDIQQQCVVINRPGLNLCGNDIDCRVNSHNVCNTNKQCVAVEGVGANECKSNDECAANSHNVCNTNKQCVVVDSAGTDACRYNSDCGDGDGDGDGDVTHNECNTSKQCVVKPGAGNNECSTSEDCAEGKTYNKCNDDHQCEAIFGIGNDTCFKDTDCENNNHHECNFARQCVQINEPGIPQCHPNAQNPSKQDDECLIYHNVCDENRKCIAIKGAGDDDCDEDSDCEEDQPPFADDLVVIAFSPGVVDLNAGSGFCEDWVSFSWNFNSPGEHDEKKYRFQVSTNDDYNDAGLIIDRNVFYPTENTQIFAVRPSYLFPTVCKPYCNFINYRTKYYWRVMVWEDDIGDGTGYASEWADYSDNPYTYERAHPSPRPIYYINPDSPAPGDTVYFEDASVCFDNNDKPYPCKCHDPNEERRSEPNCTTAADGTDLDIYLNDCSGTDCYTWTFGDSCVCSDNESNCRCYPMGDTTHIYASAKIYPSSLRVCDDVGCCTANKAIPVKTKGAQDLPQWREISPF